MKTFGIILLIMLVIFGLGAKAFLDHASPEHEHSYGEWTTKTPATCTEAGVEVRVCECNDEETREIPATGHTYGEWETKTPANCTDAEVETRKCACGAEETREGDAALGHNFTEQVATEEYLATANCGAKATYYVSCACGAKGEETFEHGDVLPHNYYVAEVFMPSCTEGGYSTYKCRTCDDSYVGDETDAAGHSYDADVTEPTCTAGGYTTYTCACGDSYVADETDAAGHSYDTDVTEPTCTAGGYTTYTCACGDSYVADETAKLDHNMVAVNDDTHHWTACSNNCGEATDKVAHSASAISASYNGDAMQHVVAEAKDFTVTGTCACGKKFAVTEGIEVVNGTLVLGENTVTVKFGDLSTTVTLNAVKFNKVVNGAIVADTYVKSGNEETKNSSFGDAKELYIYNTGMYRVFFRFNFSDVLNSEYYAEYGDEAVVKFTFTVTNGVDLTGLPVTFKSYLTSDKRSNVDFSKLTWDNYDEDTLAWGNDENPNNTVSLLAKETVGNRATYADGKLVITVTLRELDGCIDENGNAIFVLLTTQSNVKPNIASMENTEYDIPAVQVIFSEDHTHAFVEKVVDDKYLVSANCGEKAKYYVSCSCGEAGTKTFEHGDKIEHSYGEFVETQAPTCTVEGVNTKTCGKCGDTQTEAIPVIAHSYNTVVTPPTCTAEGYTTYTCSCGDVYVADKVDAKGHTYGEWLFDESYHWQACSCGDVANKATHAGGEATETEQAVCDTCKQPYGGLASHVHSYSTVVTPPTCTDKGYTTYTCNCGDVYVADYVDAKGHSFGDWATKTPADCLNAEVEIRSCACGAEETQTGDAALNHNMETKFDADNHWTKCSRCDEATEPVAHFGGEATVLEQAVCEGCGQSYGELKEAPKQEYTISGTIVEDTYVASDSGAAKNADYSTSRDTLGIGSKYYRAYFKFNISDVINSADFDPNSTDAKIQFVFTLAKGALDDKTEFTFGIFNPGEGVSDVAFSNLIWNNISPKTGTPKYPNLKWDKAHNLIDTKANDEHVTIDGSTVTLTFNYSDISDYVDANGNLIVTLRTSTSGVSIASMENTTYAIPAIKYVYYK